MPKFTLQLEYTIHNKMQINNNLFKTLPLININKIPILSA